MDDTTKALIEQALIMGGTLAVMIAIIWKRLGLRRQSKPASTHTENRG